MPTDPMALVNALNPNQDPSVYYNQLQAQQQQALANALLQQGITPMGGTESVGGVAIRRSPLEGAAKLAALLSGQSLQGQANDKSVQGMMQQAQALRGAFGIGGDPSQPGAPPPQGQMPAQSQMPQAAPQGAAPQGGPLSIAGAPAAANMLSYVTDPAAHMKAVLAQFEATPEMKMAAAAYGRGSPAYTQALQAQAAKAGYIAPEEVKQGNTVLDPRTHKPIAFGVKVADGAEPTFGTDGRMTGMPMVPGATDAMAAAKASEDRGLSQNQMVEVKMPDGTTQNMTRAQAVALAGGGSQPPTFNVKGDPAAARAQLERIPDATERQTALAAFDQKYGMPGFGSGQSTANKASTEVSAKAIGERNQAIIADANAAQQDIEALQKMIELTKTAQFGPGASSAAKWKAMAAQLPGANLIVDPKSMQDQQTNVTLMKKYMSNMAGRMSGASGTGTDARLQNAIDSLPNDAAPNEAIRAVAPLLIAQRTARLDEAKLRSKLGNDPATIQEFENQWRESYNPLAYEVTLATRGMTPQQAKAYVSSHYTPEQAADIAKSREALRGLGVRF